MNNVINAEVFKHRHYMTFWSRSFFTQGHNKQNISLSTVFLNK